MGGPGAKIRRTLERQKRDEPPVNPSKVDWPSKKHKSTHGSPRRGADNPQQRRDNSKNISKKKAESAVHKKKKFQKPKHLKRKLESVEDESKKGEILRQLEALNETKRQRTAEKPSTLVSRITATRILTGEPSEPVPPTAPHTERIRQVRNDSEKPPSKSGSANQVTVSCQTTASLPQKVEYGREDDVSNDNAGIQEGDTIQQQGKRRRGRRDASSQTKAASRPETENSGGQIDDDDSDDSESDREDDTVLQRQRGKRRRGRKDTSKHIQERSPKEKPVEVREAVDAVAYKKPQDRYCIGRKPVTDYQIGQSLSTATVVYVKPFGVFLDIGCHSDAFCHVSRLSDDYVESPEALFQPGAKVESARIVEIDRKRKRITVSLQSEARVEDERASMEARKERREKRHRNHGKKPVSKDNHLPPKPRNAETTQEQQRKGAAPTRNDPLPKAVPIISQSTAAARAGEGREKPESETTPAELKRARKLARRAARREEQTEQQLPVMEEEKQ